MLHWLGFLKVLVISKAREIKYQYKIYLHAKKNHCTISLKSNLTGDLNNLEIGEGSVVNSGANFRFKQGRIKIGRNCLFGQNISIVANTYLIDGVRNISPSHMKASQVCIGDGVWIGTNAVIMPGVVVGDNSIIGASSVVTKDIPDNQVWAGNPAVLLRNR